MLSTISEVDEPKRYTCCTPLTTDDSFSVLGYEIVLFGTDYQGPSVTKRILFCEENEEEFNESKN